MDFWKLSGLSLEEIPGHGRGVLAQKKFKAGDIIATNEVYTSFVMWAKRDAQCARCCFKASVFKCPSCSLLSYCSHECQKADFEDHHHQECPRLWEFCHKMSDLNAHQLTMAMLLSRTATRIAKTEEWQDYLTGEEDLDLRPKIKKGTAWTPTDHQVMDQCHHGCLRTFKDPESLYKVVEGLHGSRLLPQGLSVSMAGEILLRFQMNSFYIVNDLFEPVGAAVYTLGSLMNHACVPNMVATYNAQRHQVFRALRDIEVGEELVHSYVDLARSTRERQVILDKDYAFECDCKYCKDIVSRTVNLPNAVKDLDAMIANKNDPVFVGIKKLEADGNDFIIPDECLCCDKHGQVVVEPGLEGYEDEVLGGHANINLQNLLTRHCQMIDAASKREKLDAHLRSLELLSDKFHPLNLSMYSMRAEAYSLALDENADRLALTLVQSLVVQHYFMYNHVPNHPLRTLQLFTYGDLLLAAGQFQFATAVFEHVAKATRVCFGDTHEFTLLAAQQLENAARMKNQ